MNLTQALLMPLSAILSAAVLTSTMSPLCPQLVQSLQAPETPVAQVNAQALAPTRTSSLTLAENQGVVAPLK